MNIVARADRRSAFAPRTAKPSARSPKARCGWTTQAVSDPGLIVEVGDDPVKLSLGKKKHGLLR